MPRRLLPLLPLVVASALACRTVAGTAAAAEPTAALACRTSTTASLASSADPLAGVAPAIRWVAAHETGERAALDRWCAGVGPAVAVRGGSAAEPVAARLVVLTWNTHVGGGDIMGLVRDLREGDFTDGVPVEHFVLLLQETHRASADVPSTVVRARVPRPIHTPAHVGERTDIVGTARALGVELFYVPSMGNGRPRAGLPEDRGNAILSTLPLRDLAAIELPYEAQRRVAAAATVSGTTASGTPWSLRLVNVHLDNKSRASRLLRSLGGARTRQARALVQALGTDSAAVVGGDLNTWSLGFMEGAVEVLQQHFPLPAKHPTEPTYASGGLRLDRLMYRLPAATAADTRRLADRRGSDHHPLIGTIRFADDARP